MQKRKKREKLEIASKNQENIGFQIDELADTWLGVFEDLFRGEVQNLSLFINLARYLAAQNKAPEDFEDFAYNIMDPRAFLYRYCNKYSYTEMAHILEAALLVWAEAKTIQDVRDYYPDKDYDSAVYFMLMVCDFDSYLKRPGYSKSKNWIRKTLDFGRLLDEHIKDLLDDYRGVT